VAATAPLPASRAENPLPAVNAGPEAAQMPQRRTPCVLPSLGWCSGSATHSCPVPRGDPLTDPQLLKSLTNSGVDAIGSPWVRLSLTKGMIAADFLADPPGTGLDSPPKRTVRVPR
jgi:hypothetical protein